MNIGWRRSSPTILSRDSRTNPIAVTTAPERLKGPPLQASQAQRSPIDAAKIAHRSITLLFEKIFRIFSVVQLEDFEDENFLAHAGEFMKQIADAADGHGDRFVALVGILTVRKGVTHPALFFVNQVERFVRLDILVHQGHQNRATPLFPSLSLDRFPSLYTNLQNALNS